MWKIVYLLLSQLLFSLFYKNRFHFHANRVANCTSQPKSGGSGCSHPLKIKQKDTTMILFLIVAEYLCGAVINSQFEQLV